MENKPVLPPYLSILLTIHRDIVYDGAIRYSDFCLWCDRNHVTEEQFAYYWLVLIVAMGEVYKWQKKSRTESSHKK